MEKVGLNDREAMRLGITWYNAGRFADALTLFSGVAAANAGDYDAFQWAGLCAGQLKEWKDAEVWFDKAMHIALNNLVVATLNKAMALGEQLRSEEAARLIIGVLQLCPNTAMAWYNLGVLKMQLGRHEEAIEHYNEALRLDPKCAFGDSIYCRGFANLVLGNYREGFRDFERRAKAPMNIQAAQGEEWTGEQDIAGKTVLVHGELGHGDTIQFARFFPLMVARGAKVVAIVHKGIRPALEGMDGVTFVDQPAELEDPLPASDYWIRIMSLAGAFNVTLETVPPPVPIKYEVSHIDKWRKVIPRDTFNVGLCWTGRPESKYDCYRTVPLAELRPLTDLRRKHANLRFYGLQQVFRPEDSVAVAEFTEINHIGSRFHEFRRTAHALKCLDLVITVDTSVAHMAGSVGVPTWVMITSLRPYWLWVRGMDRTPWYPSMKLYRQETDGDWPHVVRKIAERLDWVLEHLDDWDAMRAA